MKFTANFAVPTIDLASFRGALDKYMLKQIIQATREWLQAATGRIPVWSGASRATFSKLAESVQFELEINPVVISRVSTGISSSDGRIETKDGMYLFKYSTHLPWLVYNEYNDANASPDPTLFAKLKQPGPYGFQLEGYQAFKLFADTVTLPPLSPYIKSRKVSV